MSNNRSRSLLPKTTDQASATSSNIFAAAVGYSLEFLDTIFEGRNVDHQGHLHRDPTAPLAKLLQLDLVVTGLVHHTLGIQHRCAETPTNGMSSPILRMLVVTSITVVALVETYPLL